MRAPALALAAALAALAAQLPVARADRVDDALARARRSGKPVLLEFRADWCGPCLHFEREVLPADDVQRALAGVELVRIDVDDDASTAAQRRFQVGVIPTFIALGPDGRVLHRVEGIADFIEDGAFAGFLVRLAARAGAGRPTEERAALERAVEREAADAGRSIGQRGASHALARAVLSGALSRPVQEDLFARHVAAAQDGRTAALAAYIAIAGGDNLGAMQAARRAVELAPDDDVAHAALAHARRSAGLRYGTMEFASACSRQRDGTFERERCEAELERLMTGRPAPAVRLLRQEADLFVRSELAPADGDHDERMRLEGLINIALRDPERAIELDRDVRFARRARHSFALARIAHPRRIFASVRVDGGDASRALAGAHAIIPLKRELDLVPTAVLRAEGGADGHGHAAYEAAAMLGFTVAGVVGLSGGIGAYDPGGGASASMTVPVELTLSAAGRRFGVEAFARATWSDEQAVGLAARLPGPFGRMTMVGARYDHVLDEHLVGLWLGYDLLSR